MFSPCSTAMLCYPHFCLCSCNGLHLSCFKAVFFPIASPSDLPSLTPVIVAFCPSQQLPPQPKTLSQTGDPNSPPLSQRSQGTWGPWAPRTGPSCLPPLLKENLGVGRAGMCQQNSYKCWDGMAGDGMGLPAPEHIHRRHSWAGKQPHPT